jgi:serine/threonine-protein kinase
MGDLAAAERDFDRAVDLDPEDPQAVLSRAGFAFATGRCEAAIWDCTEALRLRPDFVDGYLSRAQVRMALSELDEALDDLTEAVRWSPDHAGAHLQRGQLFLAMARDHDALRDFDAVIGLNPEYAVGYYLRSYCWRRSRDHARQRDDLEQAVRLAPNLSGACNSLSWLLATCPDPIYRDGRRAVALGRRALENAPELARAECLDTLAAALAESGEFAEAIASEREAISLMEDIDRRLNYERRLSLYDNHEPYREERAE